MKLTTRITKLFTADAHSVLDSMEDPLSQLKQALRDMEMSIDEHQLSLNQLVIRQKELDHQLEVVEQQYADTNEDLDVCFESDNEVLARSIVKKKLYLGQRIDQIKQSQLQLKTKKARLEEQLRNDQEQFVLIEQQAAVYLAKQPENETSQSANGSMNSATAVISDDDIEMAFLNEKRKRVNS